MFSEAEKIRHALLVLRCRRGDHHSWRELIGAFERKLFYYVRRLVSHEADAWDVLQQTWMAAYQSIGRLGDSKQLAAWLYGIARNKAIDQRRLRVEATIDVESLAESCCEERDESLEVDDIESLHCAIDRLALPHREAITLFFLEDLSVKEIAEVLHIPTGTVKSRLHNAKRELRLILQKEVTP
jgi:RNA polymerase sigma-70 factor (ECF subfamily)